MDITFWVIQALLLAPVLFMAASAGMEDRPRRGGRSRLQAPADLADDERPEPVVAQRAVAAAVSSLSQFTAEQQARLVTLRSFVQHARSSGGTLSDDMVAAPEGAGCRRLNRHQLALVVGAVIIAVGLIGVVRTSMTMGDVPLATRFLPGVIASPAKYLSAVNGGSGRANGRVDQPSALAQMEQKQAMDRWEALVGFGLSMVLFANALAAGAQEDDEGSVASDVAPFALVAAVLLAALSFLELP